MQGVGTLGETAGSKKLAEIIRRLYGIVGELEHDYHDQHRHFTLDGHLIGSTGEVYAAERYGIDLFVSSTPRHDGTSPDGRLVQVKATQRGSVALNENPDFLIVLKIDGDGEISEVYNGPSQSVWNLFENRARPKNGQYQVSLSKLKALNKAVDERDRIPALT
ncbi:hypothetical protein [Olsenella sp. HMSC062G07]|uniref:DUF6998 domain-containing protein n=1 Tax=Olsenella sp. HMSC062G07 TaxID=1739330 RepID=UPI0008A45FE5|nr:hypothetical protein [Olsenella sp. HMSC062G07]